MGLLDVSCLMESDGAPLLKPRAHHEKSLELSGCDPHRRGAERPTARKQVSQPHWPHRLLSAALQ